MASVVDQKVKIIDADLEELVNCSSLKRKEIMGATKDYLVDNDLVYPGDGRFFVPDGLIKSLFKEIGVKPEKKMMRGKLMKLFGNVAKDAGLVDY